MSPVSLASEPPPSLRQGTSVPLPEEPQPLCGEAGRPAGPPRPWLWALRGRLRAGAFPHVLQRFCLQEFAISKNIQLGDEKGLKFPSVWDWSLQFTARDRTLFHNPSYVGKSMARVQPGSVKAFKRAKVSGRRAGGSSCPRPP